MLAVPRKQPSSYTFVTLDQNLVKKIPTAMNIKDYIDLQVTMPLETVFFAHQLVNTVFHTYLLGLHACMLVYPKTSGSMKCLPTCIISIGEVSIFHWLHAFNRCCFLEKNIIIACSGFINYIRLLFWFYCFSQG